MARVTRWKDKNNRFVSRSKLDGRKAYRKELYVDGQFQRATPLQRWGKSAVDAGLVSIPRVPAAAPDPTQFEISDTVSKDIEGERNVIIQIGNLTRKADPNADAYGVRINHGGVPIKYQLIEDIPIENLDAHIQGLLFQTAREVAAERGDEIPRSAGSAPLIEIMDEFELEIDNLEN